MPDPLPKRSTPSYKRVLGILLVLALLAGAGIYGWRQELGLSAPPSQQAQAGGRRGAMRGGRGGEGAPTAVLVEAARRADVPVILEAVGTAQALNTVTVRPQVDGRLLELTFREGQDVKKGDVLARIDPTIYQAQYDQALAKKAQDEANLANSRLDLERYVSLARTASGLKKNEDTQRAAVAQLEAQLKADQGAIDTAKAYLDYTAVRAPIDGRTGFRLVDAGNLVRAGDTNGLVVITQVTPIAVLFNLPQQNLRAVNAAAARGPVQVEALEADSRNVLDTGTLEVVDNQVDQTTGTVRLKAVFPNANLQLWPGSFVNVRLTVDVIRDAVVVPTASVQRGPNGAFVYGIQEDKAVLKPVTLARQTELVSVVAAGVAPGDQVITTGFARLTDGERVRIAEPETATSDAAPRLRRTRPDGEAAGERPRRSEAGGPAAGAAAGCAGSSNADTTGSARPQAAQDRPAASRPDGERRRGEGGERRRREDGGGRATTP